MKKAALLLLFISSLIVTSQAAEPDTPAWLSDCYESEGCVGDVGIDNGMINFVWDHVSNATSYEIEICLWGENQGIHSVSAVEDSFLYDAPDGYHYSPVTARIRSVNADGCSAWGEWYDSWL